MQSTVDMDRELREDFDAMLREAWAAVLLPLCSGWIAWWAGFLRFDLVRVSVLGAAIYVVSILSVRLAANRRTPVGIYLAGHVGNIILITLVIHYAGGIALTVGPMFYLLVILNAGIVGTRWPFVLALVGTVSYAALGVAELNGWDPSPPFDPAQRSTIERQFPGTVLILAALLFVSARFALKAVGLVDARRRKLGAEAATRDLQIARARTAERRAIDDRNRVLRDRTREHFELVRLLVHDLKGPINSIFTAAELSIRADGPHMPAPAVAALERIRATAGAADDKLLELQGLFRELSIPEAIASVDLAAIVRRVVEECEPIVTRKGVIVNVGPLAAITGQRRKLRHVFHNVLSNALKYVPAISGRIDVSVASDDETVTIYIDDNGPGVRPEWRSLIFQLFWRAPDEAQSIDGQVIEGSGVGLALVKRIVERHGGAIACEESPLGGARITIRLPQQPHVRRPENPASVPVLVVDDNPLFLETLRAVLEDSRPEFAIFTAETGREMREYLAKAPPYEDVPCPAFIVLDYLLPDGLGTDLLAHAYDLANVPSIPVLVLSTKEWADDDPIRLEIAVTAFATKPSSIDALQELVLGFYDDHIRERSQEAS